MTIRCHVHAIFSVANHALWMAPSPNFINGPLRPNAGKGLGYFRRVQFSGLGLESGACTRD